MDVEEINQHAWDFMCVFNGESRKDLTSCSDFVDEILARWTEPMNIFYTFKFNLRLAYLIYNEPHDLQTRPTTLLSINQPEYLSSSILLKFEDGRSIRSGCMKDNVYERS